MEDGFLGSWHAGVVIACGEGVRRVKYDHVLVDDRSANLVEAVCVSPALDGIDSGCGGNSSNYRGCIRPAPPPVPGFGTQCLRYGQCVDVYFQEAWWEGVIFDHRNGPEERSIFFPDLGDEMRCGIKTMRVTQDWNEATGKWDQRGTWVFLELIEQFRRRLYLSVSLKQIWYDVRDKMGFEKAREWTYPMRDLWNELVLQVIYDNLSITVKELCQVLPSSEILSPESQVPLKSNQAVRDVNKDSKMYHSCAVVPRGSPSNCDMVIDNEANRKDLWDCNAGINAELLETGDLASYSNPCAVESDMDQLSFGGTNYGSFIGLLTDSDKSDQPKSVCMQPQDLLMSPSELERVSTGSSVIPVVSVPCNNANPINEKSKHSTCGNTTKWLPVTSEMLSGAQFCPGAVDEYYEHYCSGRPPNSKCKSSVMTDARKHLLYLGWKIEHMRDKRIVRLRYKSPDGKCYYSLRQVCTHLNSARDMLPSTPLDIHRSSHVSSDDRSLQEGHSDASSGKEPLQESQPHVSSDDCFLSLPGQLPESQLQIAVSPHSNAIGVIKNLPQVIVEYSLHGSERGAEIKVLGKKAKECLFSLGWRFSNSNSRGRNVVRYNSPTGKVYFSLRTACEGCLNEFIGGTGMRKLQRKTNDDLLDDESHVRQKQTNVDAKRDGLENRLEGNRKQRHPKGQNATQRRLTRGKGSVNPKDGLKVSQSKHVLRSSKRVQEVVPTTLHHNRRTILSWLIDNNVVLPREKVRYLSSKDSRPVAEGRITRDGIMCCCCRKVFTLSMFGFHAARNIHRPATNIFLEDGRSLVDCQMQIIGDRKTGNFLTEYNSVKGNCHLGENDNICSVCHYGGELVLCDGCPSSFHKSCLGLKVDSRF